MKDFDIPIPAATEIETAMPLDIAIDLACEALGLPLLGGPSGEGWSKWSTAQRCPHLYAESYVRPASSLLRNNEMRAPAEPLQVGGLYHTLQALYYGAGLGPIVECERGIRSLLPGMKGRKGKQRAALPPDAADQLLEFLKDLSTGLLSVKGDDRRPSGGMIATAEKAFDAHTSYYAHREDLEPLAIEWRAAHPEMSYSCRYDGIFRIGKDHPLTDAALPAGSTVVYERKTSAYLSELVKDGWFLDGEILGQIMCWKPSGMEKRFGPLAAVIVDVVTKTRVPQFHQVIVPTTIPTVQTHERVLRYTEGETRLWAASGYYPKRLASCFDKWGRCGNWYNCRGEI